MKVTVDKCASCVFFKTSILSLIGGGEQAGHCAAPVKTKADEFSLANSRPVEDKRILPRWCPLRLGDVVVTIGNRGTA